MRISGVICECNPPHGGHRYLLERAGADAGATVAVMSGWLTQRGEPAVLAPRVRAAMLLSMGADAVFDLPFPYAAATGESFAAAGVSMLERLGADELWFGSECGDMEKLRAAEAISGTPEFLAAYRNAARSGEGTAAAYAALLRERMGGDAPLAPNDLLAVSYLRALNRSGSRMAPRTVRRQGDAFHAQDVRSAAFPSATALRGLLRAGGADAVRDFYPPEQLARIRAEVAAGRAPADGSRLDAVFLAWLRMAQESEAERVPEWGGGIGRRLTAVAREADSFDAVLRLAGVRCPRARLRRGMLYALTRVTAADLQTPPACAVLLAANRTGCAFLAERRRTGTIPIVTKRSDVPQTSAATRQLRLTERAAALWTLALPHPVPPATLLRQSAYVEKD